ncbi:hypothetical protein PLICRDRAFT_374979 [Plicaturopsis crispa FD-325 SS-3]|uniref:Unplaced genomic scaffold PLICRscaffold_19, whole genome shotgun sequence n=1 Tax=Plicaturopsis crispa FD-325 SS-3 TaxID=944288 RepID=A0A0C9SKR8_PLICR|nr:hypothetical protein PLICRDRAFT_374979 [Plicaturopsis crispa FD-325 SS-3]
MFVLCPTPIELQYISNMATTSTRIPKATSNSKDIARHDSPLDLQTVHAALAALGAPPMTPSEFERLYKGPLAHLLSAWVEQVRGRQATAAARCQIHGVLQGEKRQAVDSPSRVEAQKAAARLAGAKHSLDALQRKLGERQDALDAAHAEAARLQAELEHKQRVGLLLSVLEAKETLRTRRFEEMARLMDDLRKAAAGDAEKELPVLETQQDKASEAMEIPRPSHTRDALATLHALHVSQTTNADAERQLRASIARATNFPECDPHVESLLRECTDLAQRRASRAPPPPPDLEGLEQSIRVKEDTLQRLSDASIAYGFLCDHLIRSVATFNKTTASDLRTSLEDVGDAKGHVEILQWLVTHAPSLEADTSFEQDVKKAFNIHGEAAWGNIIGRVQDTVRETHAQRSFLADASLGAPRAPATDLTPLVQSQVETSHRTHDAAAQLLQRKVEKANVAETLVRDVEEVLAEAGALAGAGLERR